MPAARGGDSHLQREPGSEWPTGLGGETSAEQKVPPQMISGAEGAGGGWEKASSQDSPPARDSGKEAMSSERPSGSKLAPGEIWLDGGVLACACPGCGAPMSIRLWLRLADCWRCGTSIELAEEQEQAAWRLLREQAAKSKLASAQGPSQTAPPPPKSPPAQSRSSLPETTVPPPQPAAPKSSSSQPKAASGAKKSGWGGSAWADSPPAVPERTSEVVPPRVRQEVENKTFAGAVLLGPSAVSGLPSARSRRRVLAAERAFQERLRQAQQGRPWHFRLEDWLKNLPAWMVSLIVHLVAILLLGLWVPDRQKETTITLSTSVGPYDLESELGQQPEIETLRPEFDEGGALSFEPLSAKEVLGDPILQEDPLDPGLHRQLLVNAPRNPLLEAPSPAVQPGSLLRGRDPSIRNQILYSEGGTSATEAAVARALRWISQHQNPNGSFSLHAFHQTPQCHGQCDGAGGGVSDHAATALALLPMLGAGQTHRQGEYTSVVQAALQWLLEHQKSDGDLRGSGDIGRMYAHGLATIVLCEAYALTGDSELREPAQQAIRFIVQAQHSAGGWRYSPGEAGDTSMVGWQLMALNSGRMAGLAVPSDTLYKAGRFLNSVQTDSTGATYGYLPGSGASAAMTAEALLCRQYLGWQRNHPGLREGIRFLLDRHPPDSQQTNIYYWYYGTQVFHHFGGKQWTSWNDRMRRILVDTQVRKGHAAGSWNPDPAWGLTGGRLYQTALAACTLEVYYRYLPLYRSAAVPQSAEAEGPPEPAPAQDPSP